MQEVCRCLVWLDGKSLCRGNFIELFPCVWHALQKLPGVEDCEVCMASVKSVGPVQKALAQVLNFASCVFVQVRGIRRAWLYLHRMGISVSITCMDGF